MHCKCLRGDVEIMPYIYTQLYYELFFLRGWVSKQGGSMPVRVHHEHEGACSVHLAEEEGKAILSTSQCSMAGIWLFERAGKAHFNVFYLEIPPSCQIEVYGRKYEVKERWLEAVRKGSIRETLCWQLQFCSYRVAPHRLPFVFWKHWTTWARKGNCSLCFSPDYFISTTGIESRCTLFPPWTEWLRFTMFSG